MNWYIGQKVVCLRGGWDQTDHGPKKGDLCTIYAIEVACCEVYLYFVEFRIDPSDGEPLCFDSESFKPQRRDKSVSFYQYQIGLN